MHDTEHKSDNPIFFSIVGSGAFGMNPSLVSFEMIEVTESHVRLEITGAAKEGLIKQNTSKKAVLKAISALENEV